MNSQKAVANSGATKPESTNGKEVKAATNGKKPELSQFTVSAPVKESQEQTTKKNQDFFHCPNITNFKDTKTNLMGSNCGLVSRFLTIISHN